MEFIRLNILKSLLPVGDRDFFCLNALEAVFQKFAKTNMDNALPVASLDKRSHRNDIFRLLIDDIFHNLFDVTFPFSTCYHERSFSGKLKFRKFEDGNYALLFYL